MQSIRHGSTSLVTRVGKIKFPDKSKGTLLQKWAEYWKNLFIDYRLMIQDFKADIQDDPYKTMKWVTILGSSLALAHNNPDELDFKNELKKIENQAGIVGDACLNTESIEHLRFLELNYIAGLLHYKSLGLISIMYTSDLNQSCDLYKAHCTYTKPSFFSFPTRIVDVGVMGCWWNLYRKTTDYDINDSPDNSNSDENKARGTPSWVYLTY